MTMRLQRLVGPAALSAMVLLGGLAATEEERAESVPEPTYDSPINICMSADGETAYVVNETANSVAIVDVRRRKVTGQITVGDQPNHAALSPDGRTLYVSSRQGYTVDAVDLAKKSVVQSFPTEYEPCGLCVSPDGSRLYVANSQSDTLSIIDTGSGKTVFTVKVGRDPQYIAQTPDGTRLIVSGGLSRSVSIVDPARGHVVETRDLDRASVLRHVLCSPDGKWGFTAHLVAHDEAATLQMERGWILSNGISIMDLDRRGHYVTLLLDRLLQGAANPWGLAMSPDAGRLYVSLAGVHEVAIVDVAKAMKLVAETRADDMRLLSQNVEIDAVTLLSQNVEIVEKRGIARRVPSGGLGPRGMAFSAATDELLVANYFSGVVSVLDPGTGEVRARIPLGPEHEMTLWRKGQLLFNDARICYQSWFSCASCHQEDGTVDALNWDLANDGLGNPKNAKSLHDVVDTPPAMWAGVRADIDAAVQAGQRFLGSIPDPDNHAALVEFIGNPRRARNIYRTRNPDALARGKKLFVRARCVVCHPGPTYTDLQKHDVGLAAKTDLRSAFFTPSLRDCYRTGPYLHDGRAETLREIFTDHNPNDFHGRTSGLTPAQLEDLLEYLRSL